MASHAPRPSGQWEGPRQVTRAALGRSCAMGVKLGSRRLSRQRGGRRNLLPGGILVHTDLIVASAIAFTSVGLNPLSQQRIPTFMGAPQDLDNFRHHRSGLVIRHRHDGVHVDRRRHDLLEGHPADGVLVGDGYGWRSAVAMMAREATSIPRAVGWSGVSTYAIKPFTDR